MSNLSCAEVLQAQKKTHLMIAQRYQEVVLEFNSLLHKCIQKYRRSDYACRQGRILGVKLRFLLHHYYQLDEAFYRFNNRYCTDNEYWKWKKQYKDRLVDIRLIWHEWLENHYLTRCVNLGDLYIMIQLRKYLSGDLQEWYDYIGETPPEGSHFIGTPLEETLFLEVAQA